MNKNVKTILTIASVAFVIMLIINGAVQAVNASPAGTSDISEPVNDDDIPTAYIHSPLVFNNTDGAASAAVINTAAGKTVCSYENGTLAFSDSVMIVLDSTVTNDNLFTFNAHSDQTISVKDGYDVIISCNNNDINITENKDYAVINCDSSLTFTGDGRLRIVLKNTTFAGTYSWDVIYAKVNVHFDHNKLEFYNDAEGDSAGYGVVYSGQDIKFTKCEVTGETTGHTFYCRNTNTNNYEFNQCNVKAYSDENAFEFSGGTFGTFTMTTMYGSYGSSQMEEISTDKISWYDKIEVRANDYFGLDGTVIAIIIAVIIGAAIAVWIITKLVRRGKVLETGKNLNPVNYEPVLPTNESNKNISEDHTVIIDNSPKKPENSIEITVSTTIDNMSFALLINGRVIGYIGHSRSALYVPRGMQEVTIVINDMSRKEIYRENIYFRGPVEFTVKKKRRGYAIEKR